MAADEAVGALDSCDGLGFVHDPAVEEAYFRACAPQHLESLRQVGLLPGWRVLDAGCGNGCYLPWIVDLVGRQGRITAVDADGGQVARAAGRVGRMGAPCPVEVARADVVRLPFDDGVFDAVWCADTVRCLGDEELAAALAEYRRVLRPGGTLAVKERAPHLLTVRPADSYLFSDYFRAAAEAHGCGRRLLRAVDLHLWLTKAGFVNARQRTVLTEHYAPLPGDVLRYYGPACERIACQAGLLGLGERWSAFADRRHPANPLLAADAYISEGSVLCVAVKGGR